MSNENLDSTVSIPKGKDICPQCEINVKGIKAKTCRPCAKFNLAQRQKPKAKPEPDLKAIEAELQAKMDAIDAAHANSEAYVDSEPEPELKPEPEVTVPSATPNKVGAITTDGKFYTYTKYEHHKTNGTNQT